MVVPPVDIGDDPETAVVRAAPARCILLNYTKRGGKKQWRKRKLSKFPQPLRPRRA